MKQFTVLFVAMSVLLVGCNKRHHDKYNPVKNIKEAAKDKDLQEATFSSECRVKPVGALVSGLFTEGKVAVKGEQVSYRFDGANVLKKTRYFIASDCSGDSVFSFQESGTFKIDKDQKTNDGGHNVDLEFNELKGLPTAEPGVAVANAVKLCGITNWVQGEEKDVRPQSADLNCYAAKVPRKVLNVYRVDDGNLYLGVVTASSERPSKLDLTQKYASKK